MQYQPLIDSLRRTAGEPRAFKRFYSENLRELLAYMVRRVYDVDTALDLTAETFAQAFIGARRFRGKTDVEARAWLYGIGSRQLALYFRRSAVEQRALRRLGVEPPRLSDDEQDRVLELAAIDDLRAEVRKELNRLSQPQRDALELRIVAELPYVDVAGRLGITEQAARARVARGLKGLAAALNPKLMKERSL